MTEPSNESAAPRDAYERFTLGLGLTLCAALSAFTLYSVMMGQLTAQVQRGVFLLGAGLAVSLLKPTHPRWHGSGRRSLRLLDRGISLVFMGLLSFAIVYLLSNYYEIANYRDGLPNTWDLICYGTGVVAVLEGVRRSEGYTLLFVILTALAYLLWGHLIPGLFGHHGVRLSVVLEMAFGLKGVFGIALAVVAKVIFIFVLYGAVLRETGAGELFIKVSFLLTGRMKGGPALSAVVASALFGTINGSGPANVVSTGAFTIPLMKRIGYRDTFAAGVEAAASTVGQILPPIMGVGAFIMAEITGLSYLSIMIAAIVPALLYIASLLINVRLRALAQDLPLIPAEEIPRLDRGLAARLVVLVVSVATVMGAIIVGVTPAMAGLGGIASLLAASLFIPDMRPTPRGLVRMLVQGGRDGMGLTMACAGIGIIIGTISTTGIGIKLVQLILTAGESSLFLALIAAAVCCLIIGMGLPTAASYLMVVYVAAPAITQLGLPLLTAHLFIFYYAVLSAITPPVAICAYAAAGIAGAPILPTAVQAVRLGAVGFLLPMLWAFSPELMLNFGGLGETALAIGGAVVTVVGLAAGNIGYLFRTLTIWERLLVVGVAALAMWHLPAARSSALILAPALAGYFWMTAARLRAVAN